MALSLFVACSALSSNSPVAVQLAHGEPIYREGCTTEQCHGTEGQGRRNEMQFVVWPLVGEDFQLRHPNTQVIFDVVRSGDEQSLRQLTDQDIYDAIAYELSLNDIDLAEPLTRENATMIFGGQMQGQVRGGIFPPVGNVQLDPVTVPLVLPQSAANDTLSLQLDQFARATTIAGDAAPYGGSFAILVLTLEVRIDKPIEVNPEFLHLMTDQGDSLIPMKTAIRSAIETFHRQTIQPEHGTAALVVFVLPASAQPAQLIYDDGLNDPLTVNVQP